MPEATLRDRQASFVMAYNTLSWTTVSDKHGHPKLHAHSQYKLSKSCYSHLLDELRRLAHRKKLCNASSNYLNALISGKYIGYSRDKSKKKCFEKLALSRNV